MNMIPLRAELYIDFDDISFIIQRPDVNGKMQKYVDVYDRNLYERANEIIEDAKAKGKYFDVSGRDEVVRCLIITKSGIVIGTNNNPETIVKKYTAEMRAKKTQEKKARGRT